MIKEYSEFLLAKSDYWRKAKQYEYQDIDRIVLALQNIEHYTTRNTMTLRLLGLVENLGNDNLEITNVGEKFLESSEKQKIIDEQLLKISLDSTINSGISIPVFPLQIIYLIFKELEYITFEEYMLFVCWIEDSSEVPLVVRLISEYRNVSQETAKTVNQVFESKRREKGTQDFGDNVGRLFNMYTLSSFIASEGTRLDRALYRDSSPEIYDQLAKILDRAEFDDYIEFDYKYQGLITFIAEHKEITKSLQSLTIEERKILHKSIKESEDLPALENVHPVAVSPTISHPKTKGTARSAARGRKAKFKPDYSARENRNRIIGLRAENVVVKYEFGNLMKSGKSDLARRVERVSKDDDSLGYDIVSFTPEGEEKHIEVKAIVGYPTTFRFFISINEIEKARSDPIFCINIVFDCKSSEPKIWELPNIFKSPDPRVSIEPVKFAVTVTIKK